MERRPPSWTFGGVSVVALLALAWLGTAGWGVWNVKAQASQAKAATAGVHVVVTDGTDARLWIERPGAPPRAMPLSCETAPGPVSLRVARHTADGAWRQDTVAMDLQPDRLHLVPVGGEPVRIETRSEPPCELPLRHPFPGVVTGPKGGPLGLGDPQNPVPLDTLLSAQPEIADWLPAGERLLVAANPFAREIRVRVAVQHADGASGWQQECTLPALGSRVFALGSAAGVRVSCTRADDGAFLGESACTPPAVPGRPLLYTVGGATVYAWVGHAEGTMPPVPTGEWAELPESLRIRTRRAEDPSHWILIAGGPGGNDVGLSPLASGPLPAFGPANLLQARADVVARELALPAQLKGKAVGIAAAAGEDLWGVVDGVVHDLRTGRPLHARGPELVAQMTATPHGVVLLTRTGKLATLKDGRLALGASFRDPALRLAPAAGDPPAVWLYGGAFSESGMVRQPLDGSPGTRQARSGMDEEGDLAPTAIALGSGDCLLLASGRRIERLQPQPDTLDVWSIQPLLTLPEGGPDVIGLLDLDGRLVFATEECVYELRGDLVLPLVEGIGGTLVSWRGGLAVCDARSGRLYHLSGPAFLAPNGGPR